MDIAKAREVASLQNKLDGIQGLLKEIRVLQKEHSSAGVVTLTIPARWLTDLATLALNDIEGYENAISDL